MTIERGIQADSPRLSVTFNGKEYSGANGPETFEVTSTLTNIYDGWTLDLPVGPQGLNEDIPALNIHRWAPIMINHADPRVDSGKPIPLVMGICTRVEHQTSANASVLRLSGYDIGKLLDSCVKPFIRLRGVDFGTLIDKLLDPSWRRAPGPVTDTNTIWGIQGVSGLFRDQFTKLGKRVSNGRAEAQLNAGGTAYGSFVPPIQTEVGETVYSVLARYARLTGLTRSQGSFVSASADGYIQVFNPDDYKNNAPIYVFNDTMFNDVNNHSNIRIENVSTVLDGEDLYTDYGIFGSVVQPPVILNPNKIVDPNFGRFSGQASNPNYLGDTVNRIRRSLTESDPEQYVPGFAEVRAGWRLKQSLYRERSYVLTVQGHSMPGPDGQWRPIVEGNIAQFYSTRHKVSGNFMIEQVIKRQNASVGTQAVVTLRQTGLLGA